MRINITNWLFALLLVPLAAFGANEDVQRAIALADYIAGDYEMAVASEGKKIISEPEYAEMIEFSDLINYYVGQLDLPPSNELRKSLRRLKTSIEQKESVDAVRVQASNLREHLIRDFAIPTFPSKIPDLARGKAIYQQTCAICHGMDGRANTPTAKQIDPPPRSFADPSTFETLSPFQAFNSVTFGVRNTGMASFAFLSESDRWALASYIFRLRSDLPPPSKSEAQIPWQEAMKKSDSQLIKELDRSGVAKNKQLQQLSQIRHLVYPASRPATVAATNNIKEQKTALAGVVRAQEDIRESLIKHRAGDDKTALNLAVSAYLDGFEKSEVILTSLGKTDLVLEVEKNFISYRNQIRNDAADLDKSQNKLLALLGEAEQELRASKELSPWAAALGSFLILFREGLEAILLLAIIFSVLTAVEARNSIRWFHGSWIVALISGAVTWFAAQKILSGAVREGLEGWVSLLAAAVLLYVSFWLIARKDADRWRQYLIQKLKGERGFAAASIAFVTFIAVYREAFETILFYEALRLQAQTQVGALIAGAVVAVVLLAGTAWVILKTGKRLPLNLIFGLSGIFLYFLAIVFVGQGVHNLQEADIIRQTPIPFISISSLGIFPYLESLLPQFALVFIFMAALIWQQSVRRIEAETQLKTEVAHVSEEMFNIHELGEHLLEHLGELNEKLARGNVNKEEVREMMDHMKCMDDEIHEVIQRMEHIQSDLPRRFEAILEEVRTLSGKGAHPTLRDKAEEFRKHLETLS